MLELSSARMQSGVDFRISIGKYSDFIEMSPVYVRDSLFLALSFGL